MYTDQPAFSISASKRKIVILPVGSCEQHGPYLPIDTDLRIAKLIAENVAASLPTSDKLLLPAIPFSASWEHKGLGTIALNISTISATLHDIASSLKTWGMPLFFVLINWHGGNSLLASLATEITATEGIPTIALQTIVMAGNAWSSLYGQISGDVHAGAIETSIIQAYWPELMQWDIPESAHFEPDIAPVQTQIALQAIGIHALTQSGIWGNPEDSDPSKGLAIINMVVKDAREEILKLLEIINSNQRSEV